MSISGAFEARTRAAVVPRPDPGKTARAERRAEERVRDVVQRLNITACGKWLVGDRARRERAAAGAGVGVGICGASAHHARGHRTPARRSSSRSSNGARKKSCSASPIPTCGATSAGPTIRITSSISASRNTGPIRSPICRVSTAQRLTSSAPRRSIGTADCRGASPRCSGNLRRAFGDFPRNAPYTVSDTVLFSSVAAHYMQDAHQPFHATDNYDGVATGQRGIHARFERDLIERFASRLRLESRSRDADRRAAGRRLRRVAGELPGRRSHL